MTRVLDREGLQAIVAGLTGLSPAATIWALDPEPMIGDQDRARVVMQLFSMESLGVDEHRPAFGPPGFPADNYVITELGNRTLRITMRAEVFDAEVEAAELLDAIRTGIRTEASTEALNAINLAFVESHPATYVRYIVDDRHVNAAIADFVFAGIAQLVSDPNADYIETVNGNNVVPGTITS